MQTKAYLKSLRLYYDQVCVCICFLFYLCVLVCFGQIRQRSRLKEYGFQLTVTHHFSVFIQRPFSVYAELHCSLSSIEANVTNTIILVFFYYFILFSYHFVKCCTLHYSSAFAVKRQSFKIQQHSKFLPKLFSVAAQWKSWTILWWDDCIGSIEYLLLVCLH